MNDLFVFAAHNTVVALVLALFVCGLTHFWRNPPAAHVIWLLVLVRLVAPPVVRLEVFAPRLAELPHARGRETAQESRIEARNDLSQPTFNDLPTSQTTAEASATRNVRDEPAATFALFWNPRSRSLSASGLAAQSCACWSPRRGSFASSVVCETRFRGPLLRRLGPLGIPRSREAIRRASAPNSRVAKRIAGQHSAVGGHSVFAFSITKSED